MKLELSEGIQLAHPFNKGFDDETACKTEDEAIRVAHGEVLEVDQSTDDGDAATENANITVYTTSFYVGLVMDTSMSCEFDA